MHPPTKDQTDIGADEPTLDASNSPDNKDRARQEFKNDADLHYMLQKFGVVQPRGTPIYGEFDETLDLQNAVESVKLAEEAFGKLPEDLQRKFGGNMGMLLTAINNGSLVIKDGEAPPERKTAEQERLDKMEADIAAFNKRNHAPQE